MAGWRPPNDGRSLHRTPGGIRSQDGDVSRNPVREELAARGRCEPFNCAYIGGTFDTLHRGHLALFRAAHDIAREVVVSLNTDEFAARYKRQPLMPLADRMAVLSSCRLVDRVIVNTGDEDSKPAIRFSGADCVVHGTDWPRESLMAQMGLTVEWLALHGVEMVFLPYTPWTSTTHLLAEYDARKAAA